MDKFRVYFLIYEDLDAILLVTIRDKKAQQDVIDEIKQNLDKYYELIKKKISVL